MFNKFLHHTFLKMLIVVAVASVSFFSAFSISQAQVSTTVCEAVQLPAGSSIGYGSQSACEAAYKVATGCDFNQIFQCAAAGQTCVNGRCSTTGEIAIDVGGSCTAGQEGGSVCRNGKPYICTKHPSSGNTITTYEWDSVFGTCNNVTSQGTACYDDNCERVTTATLDGSCGNGFSVFIPSHCNATPRQCYSSSCGIHTSYASSCESVGLSTFRPSTCDGIGTINCYANSGSCLLQSFALKSCPSGYTISKPTTCGGPGFNQPNCPAGSTQSGALADGTKFCKCNNNPSVDDFEASEGLPSACSTTTAEANITCCIGGQDRSMTRTACLAGNGTVGSCSSNGSTQSCTNTAECINKVGQGFVCSQTPYGNWCTRSTSNSCGNGTCDINEGVATCAKDCLGVVTDCHTGGAPCGTGLTCQEPAGICVSTTANCGNGRCDIGENQITCGTDCGVGGTQTCGVNSSSGCGGKSIGTSCKPASTTSGYCALSGSQGNCTCTTGGSGSGTGGVVTPPSGSCSAGGTSCEASDCCQTGYVCQGTSGSRVCQKQVDGQCGTGKCEGYVSFKCSSLTVTGSSSGVGVCESNGVNHGDDRSAAVNRAQEGSCGQVDQVCVGGERNGQLCGEFTIYSSSCGSTTPPPGTNPPSSNPPSSNPPGSNPPSSNPPGPLCLSLTASKSNPGIGEAVTFTCGNVQGATKYEFRVVDSLRRVTALEATGRTSAPFTVPSSGSFKAQCRICTGSNGSNCQAYEPAF